ncbi:MAG: methyltransferase domain-containing protein [Gammaproteobacteria bacterium]|nr:methyltransferase domain-containing protein [Gammaproteobacteria bacterium]
MFDLKGIRDWYQTDAGEIISHAIEQHVWRITSCIFGYSAIQVGDTFANCELLKNCTISEQVRIDRSSSADIISSPAALPICSDSIDLFVLPHALDFTEKPHEILREVERCLVPEGYMIIVGFNPYSFYGLWRLFLSRKKQAPWSAKFYSVRRLRDWSSLLGFEEVELHFTAHLPPFKRIQGWKKMQSLGRILQYHLSNIGGVYIFVARKRVARLTLLKRVWPTATNQILTGKLPKPTVGMHEDVESR